MGLKEDMEKVLKRQWIVMEAIKKESEKIKAEKEKTVKKG